MKATEDFEQFFKASYANTYYLALSIVHDEEVGKDIVADAFEGLLARYQSHDMGNSDLSNYLYIMVRNKCADYFRHHAAHGRYADWAQHAMPVEYEDCGEHERKVEEVRAALHELAPRTRQVMEAHYLRGMKYAEVAAELGISEHAVKKHVVTGLRYLRKKFVKECFAGVVILVAIALLL